MLHQSPRNCGQPTSLWTLELAARVCFEKGWTARLLSGEDHPPGLKRLGIGCAAKHWLVSPDPEYGEKTVRDLLIEEARGAPRLEGFQDET